MNSLISSTSELNINSINSPPKAQSLLVPPLNFAMVNPGVYRAGHPNKKNFKFLKKLKLKSIIYLCPDDYTPEMIEFCEENNIKVFQYFIKGNKEPFQEIDQSIISDALVQLLDVRNHPTLVHCMKGKARVGCLVGCLRKLQKWSLTCIFDEFSRFSGAKVKVADQEFIELFSHPVPYNNRFKPIWFLQ